LKINAHRRFALSRNEALKVFTERCMTTKHLTQEEVAQRWRISPRTLERWRWTSQGPRYIKLGGRVVYRIEDIEAFEAKKTRAAGQ
jgi:predicted DNA-binding transcriptional regulator AlpA